MGFCAQLIVAVRVVASGFRRKAAVFSSPGSGTLESLRCIANTGSMPCRSSQSVLPAVLLIAVLASACQHSAEAEPADSEPRVTPNDAAWYATALQRLTPLGRIAGMREPSPLPRRATDDPRFDAIVTRARSDGTYALVIWHRDAIVLEHYFGPYTSELRPESASMHKSVLGLAMAAAISDGAIDSVDDPVGRYVTAWQNDARGAITLRQLLTMSGGLAPLSSVGGTDSAAYRFWTDGAAARATVLGLDLRHEPGTVFHYDNAVPQLLLMVLEQATGSDYETYLSERIWRPIGAADAFVWRNEPDGFPRAQSALLARAEDWLRLGLLILNDGAVVGRSIIDSAVLAMLGAPSATNPNYGWLLWRGAEYTPVRFYNDAREGLSVRASAPYRISDWLYFDGYGGQRVYVSRAAELVIVRLGALRHDWDDAALPNLVAAAIGVPEA